MFAAESYTSRHYIAIVAMACLCVLLGGPSYAAGAESLIIAGATYYEPGVSGPGGAWTDGSRAECWCKGRFLGRRKQEAVIA